jgi:acylphosphatase
MSGNGNVRVRVLISGYVQTVGFRFFTKREADRLNLSGWVQNLNGTKQQSPEQSMVEAEFQGPSDDVEKILKACEKGNGVSRETKVERLHSPSPKQDDSGFVLRDPKVEDVYVNEEPKRVRVLISGSAQDQDLLKKEAKVLNISGSIEDLNGTNKRVEAVFQGTSENIEAMIQTCKKMGGSPEDAEVKVLHRYSPEAEENSFTIK